MHRLTKTFLIAVAAAVIVAARGRRYPLRVVFFRPFSIDPVEAANSRQNPETMMAHILHLQQTYRQARRGVSATIRAVVRAVAAEHTLAMRAATKAASPRQSLAEVRAMYVPPLGPHQEVDVVARSTSSAAQTPGSCSSSPRARLLRAWRQPDLD